jgi:hypothetical protein
MNYTILIIRISLALLLAGPGIVVAQSWQPLENQPAFAASTALLLTDGTVLCHQYNSGNWWRLTPDSHGDYVKGTWSSAGSLPAGYAPLYYSSAVLADGRVVVAGGEYNFLVEDDTNKAAVYDPLTNVWTPLAAPDGWTSIGDAQNAVLPDGKFMMADPFGTQTALLDPKTLTWTPTGTGKADTNDEEGWTLLPDGSVLTIDVWNPPHAEKYLPSTGDWISAGSTPVSLTEYFEMGPAVLRPNGSVFATGANGHTAIYHPPSHASDPGSWTQGPDFPIVPGQGQLDIADGPAALLPNGNVLCAASPGLYRVPTHFFEFDGANLNPVAATPRASLLTSFEGRMLLLPSGQVLFTDGSSDVEIYTPAGSHDPHWEPRIHHAPLLIKSGSSYEISGAQFNGLSQAVAYGDDVSAATNYPLVRIKNLFTGDVFYARTHDHSTMGVATGSEQVATRFDVPAGVKPGIGEVVVVANGIASKPWFVLIE